MDSVHYFVRGLFRGTQETIKITEQREELETHIYDRITDCMSSGMSESDAFQKVIGTLGNLDELIETMTGEKKKIYIAKEEAYYTAIGALYGTFYMIAVGIWFYYHSFGLYAAFIAIPGLLGFVVPAVFKYIIFAKNPQKTAVVPVDISDEVRFSFIGWAGISIASWIVNFILVGSGTFLSVIWAWMPMFGLFSWPLMTYFSLWMRRNSKSLVLVE